MSATVLHMSMSLDGYIADRNDFLGGDSGERLHDWFASDNYAEITGPDETQMDELSASGAVVTGRRTAELMDHWGGDVFGGVPIFVPSHRPPGPAARWGYPNVTYVTDGIASAMDQARAAAGDKDVHVQGAYTGQTAIDAGVLDEIQVHLIPVLLGGGRRLFDVLRSQVELHIAQVIDTPQATHLRYRVRR